MTALLVTVIGIVLITAVVTDGFGIITLVRERKNRHKIAEVRRVYRKRNTDTGTRINKINKSRR